MSYKEIWDELKEKFQGDAQWLLKISENKPLIERKRLEGKAEGMRIAVSIMNDYEKLLSE